MKILESSPRGLWHLLGKQSGESPRGFESLTLRNPSLKLRNCMHYTYILLSSKSHIFYFGSTNNLKNRLDLHNSGQVVSTKPHLPWKLVWYGVFQTEKQARNFELYLKHGSGKAFAYKRLVSVALAKDFEAGIKGSPKPRAQDTSPSAKLYILK